MSFLDKFLSLFSPGASAKAAAPSSPPRPQKRTKKQREAQARADRRRVAKGLTNRRTITFRDEDGRVGKQVVAKKNGEWNFHYDRDWFPVRGLPPGELKSALAAKGVS